MKRLFTPFTTNEIKPHGWLKDQLIIQAKGLSGNLDKMWPDVRDSSWIGGNKDGWERVPYWLDGFIPLAYLLDDDDMKARAQKYIDAIIAGQKEDGWICPCSDEQRKGYDMWALFLLLKVLIVYYDSTKDERIEEVVYRALKQFSKFNNQQTIFNWGHARWYECVISIAWIYARRPEEWMLSLAYNLEAGGMDHAKVLDYLKKPATEWTFQKHVVNLAMYLKADAVMSMLDNRNPEQKADKFLKFLQKYHGNVNEYFNGDECLPGTAPIKGTELCGVAEAMYSYEVIASMTKSTIWMDRCERLAFNAFPATVSEDMWTHQYDQMSNQPFCVGNGDKSHFCTNGPESHIFGLEPNFGCCTANFNQAFPKFALSTYMKANDGIAVTSLAPSSLSTVINGSNVTIITDTLYPFRDSVSIKVECDKPTLFTLYIRIPSFVKSAKVNGVNVKVGEYYALVQEFSSQVVDVKFEFETKLVKRGKMYAIVRGPLTYTLPVKERWEMREYERNGVERKFPYCDYYIYPESEWQYAIASTDFEYVENDEYKCAFSTSAPLCGIRVKVKKINWGLLDGFEYVPAALPKSVKPIGDEEEITFVPYACAKLRMTELPLLKK